MKNKDDLKSFITIFVVSIPDSINVPTFEWRKKKFFFSWYLGGTPGVEIDAVEFFQIKLKKVIRGNTWFRIYTKKSILTWAAKRSYPPSSFICLPYWVSTHSALDTQRNDSYVKMMIMVEWNKKFLVAIDLKELLWEVTTIWSYYLPSGASVVDIDVRIRVRSTWKNNIFCIN
jgi:hypothetical protein